MKLVDVYCHLNQEYFADKLVLVLERAKAASLKAIVISGVNPPGNREVLKLAQKDPLLKVSLGIYPIDALGLSEGESGLPRQLVPINLEDEFEFIRKNKE